MGLLKEESWFDLPTEKIENYHVYTQFPILLKTKFDGDLFIKYLASKVIRGTNTFPYSCPSTPALKQLGNSETFPKSLLAARNNISLPNNPFLNNRDINFISSVVSDSITEIKNG